MFAMACHQDPLSSSLNNVSFDLDSSWAAKSWDAAYSLRRDRARFQQKQLQEKEQKLLRLYEEQQERAMQRVGSRAQSGGSSVSSSSSGSVGAGKVRSLFQSRRGTSEPRAAAQPGRDRSHPLQPLHPLQPPPRPTRTQSFKSPWTRSELQLDRDPNEAFQKYLDDLEDLYEPRRPAAKSNVLYFGGSHTDLRFSEELDFGQSFHVIDDQRVLENLYPRRKKNPPDLDDDYFVKSFNNKRQFYEDKFSGEAVNGTSLYQKLPNVGLSNSFRMNQKQESTAPGKYKTYVSGNVKKSTFAQNAPAKSGLPTRQNGVTKKTVEEPGNRATSPPMKVNGVVRKQTPIPSTVTPNIQRELRKPLGPSIPESPSEVMPPIPASRTTVPRTNSAANNTVKMASGVKRSAAPKSALSDGTSRLVPQQDLVTCKICGRHFLSDRINKHQAICRKMQSSKRKTFDAVKQRVRGTGAEKYVKASARAPNTLRRAPPSTPPAVEEEEIRRGPTPRKFPSQTSQKPAYITNWRKKHEEFISSIRAAKEVQVHLKKGGKLSDLPPPPPSDYSDYVPCPHCGRKFNETAAERHIPKCATMLHNKPNPNLVKKKPGMQVPASTPRGSSRKY